MTRLVTVSELIGDFGEFWKRARPGRPFSVVREILSKTVFGFFTHGGQKCPGLNPIPSKVSPSWAA